MDHYEIIDAMLDRVVLDSEGYVNKLSFARTTADHYYNMGALADYQWRALVNRSAKIQDMLFDRNIS